MKLREHQAGDETSSSQSFQILPIEHEKQTDSTTQQTVVCTFDKQAFLCVTLRFLHRRQCQKTDIYVKFCMFLLIYFVYLHLIVTYKDCVVTFLQFSH